MQMMTAREKPLSGQIVHGGSAPLQTADPPSPRMLARNRGLVKTKCCPFLATIRERSPKNTRRSAEIVVSKAACAYIQRRVKRYRTHKIASALAIENAVITQKTMSGYALPLSLNYLLQMGRYPGRGCL